MIQRRRHRPGAAPKGLCAIQPSKRTSVAISFSPCKAKSTRVEPGKDLKPDQQAEIQRTDRGQGAREPSVPRDKFPLKTRWKKPGQTPSGRSAASLLPDREPFQLPRALNSRPRGGRADCQRARLVFCSSPVGLMRAGCKSLNCAELGMALPCSWSYS